LRTLSPNFTLTPKLQHYLREMGVRDFVILEKTGPSLEGLFKQFAWKTLRVCKHPKNLD